MDAVDPPPGLKYVRLVYAFPCHTKVYLLTRTWVRVTAGTVSTVEKAELYDARALFGRI